MHGLTEGRSVRPAVRPGEGNSPTIKPYREYVPLRCFRALWRGKWLHLLLWVLVTRACGIKLAFAMCLLQCLHCTDEAHIGRNRGSPVCSLIAPTWLNLPSDLICLALPNCWALFTGVVMLLALVQDHSPVYRCFRALWRGKVAELAFVSVSHPGMWYKACVCHVSAPVSALHWWGPHRPKQRQPFLQ